MLGLVCEDDGGWREVFDEFKEGLLPNRCFARQSAKASIVPYDDSSSHYGVVSWALTLETREGDD
jgi:hypothetical protein